MQPRESAAASCSQLLITHAAGHACRLMMPPPGPPSAHKLLPLMNRLNMASAWEGLFWGTM